MIRKIGKAFVIFLVGLVAFQFTTQPAYDKKRRDAAGILEGAVEPTAIIKDGKDITPFTWRNVVSSLFSDRKTLMSMVKFIVSR